MDYFPDYSAAADAAKACARAAAAIGQTAMAEATASAAAVQEALAWARGTVAVSPQAAAAKAVAAFLRAAAATYAAVVITAAAVTAAHAAAAGTAGAIATLAIRWADTETGRAADMSAITTVFAAGAKPPVHIKPYTHIQSSHAHMITAGGDYSCAADGDVADGHVVFAIAGAAGAAAAVGVVNTKAKPLGGEKPPYILKYNCIIFHDKFHRKALTALFYFARGKIISEGGAKIGKQKPKLPWKRCVEPNEIRSSQ